MRSDCSSFSLYFFFQELLGFVDLGRKVRTSATVGVVKQHERAVLLAQQFFRHASFPDGRSALVFLSVVAATQWHSRHAENQRSFFSCHLGLEAAFVESPS